MTLAELVMTWAIEQFPTRNALVNYVDENYIVLRVDGNQLSANCLQADEGLELPGVDIEDGEFVHSIGPRRAFEKGTCLEWSQTVEKFQSSKSLEVVLFYPDLEIPPLPPGISGILHYIKDSDGGCLEHFEDDCKAGLKGIEKIYPREEYSIF